MRVKSHYSLSKILRIISYSRQAYYKSKKRMNQKNIYKSVILSFAEDMIKLFPKMGIDKLYYSIKGKLEALSIKYGRDKFRKLMRQVTFRAKQKRKKKSVFYNVYEGKSKFVNRVKCNEPNSSNHQWHIDITQLKYKNMNLYMTVILDGYSRKIVSHVVSNTLKSQETSLKALEKGLLYGVPETIHSDRGLQFVCNDWEEALGNFNINSSYSQKGTPTENGKIERVFSTLKSELGLRKIRAENIEEYLDQIERKIDLYNQKRPHQSLNYSTPNKVFYNNNCQPILA